MSAKADRARSGGWSVPPGGVLSGLLPVLLLCATASPAPAQTRTVTFTNHSSATVREIYIDDAEGKAPGGNRLRSRLPPNARASITYSQGCRANVRVVLDDRTMQEHRGADVCARTAFAVTGGAPSAVRPPGRQGPDAAAGAAQKASQGAPRGASSGASGAGAARGHGAPPPPEPVPWTGRSITKRLTLDGYR